MSSLRAPIFENSHFVAEVYFIFIKTSPRSNFRCFEYQIWTSVKDRKSSYQVKQILSLFCKLVTLNSD